MRNWPGVLVKVAVTALILATFAWQLDFRSVTRTLSAISVFAVTAAVVVVLVQVLVQSQRLVMVVARLGARIRRKVSFRITLEAMFFSQTFISFVGGDALRIWRIRRLGLPLTEATTAVVLDRLIGIVVNHIFLIGSLPWLLTVISDTPVRIALVFLAVSGIGGFALILLIAYLRSRSGYLRRLRARVPIRRVATLIVEASSVGRHFMMQYRQLVAVMLVSSLAALANMMIFAIILLGMGVDAFLAISCALLVPAVLEISMLPISIAGWGLREGAAIVAFGTLGLQTEQALASSLAFGLIQAGVGLLGGASWLADRREMAEIPTDRDRPNVLSDRFS